MRSDKYNSCVVFTDDMSIFQWLRYMGLCLYANQLSLHQKFNSYSSQLIAKLNSYPYIVSPDSCDLLFCGQDLASCISMADIMAPVVHTNCV